MKEKIREKIKLDPGGEEDGANEDVDSMRIGKSAVIKTSTRKTVYLPVVGLGSPDELRPGDPIGCNKGSYYHPGPGYGSHMEAMGVDEPPTETHTDIGGFDKQIEELAEAIVYPMKHLDRFEL